MINLADLGLEPAPTPAQIQQRPEPNESDVFADLDPGSTQARALFESWRGQPVVSVSSPPGGGKTTLLVWLAVRLAIQAGLQVTVVTPTRAGAWAVGAKLSAIMPPGTVNLVGSAFAKSEFQELYEGLVVTKTPSDHDVLIQVRTVASASISSPRTDVMLFDEAYQTTFASAAAAAERAEQVVMVGDPGQIGPVTTIDTRAWEGFKVAPHHRAPEGFAQHPGAVQLYLPSTYRLGPTSAEIVAPLYDFEFNSARPDLSLDGHDEVAQTLLPTANRVADPEAMKAVADHAMDLVGTHVRAGDRRMELQEDDVTVVAARNEQIAMISALLRSGGRPGITVGTADSLQGGQWAAVVALDPYYGAVPESSHAASLGRLCVMTSRHIAHLRWVSSLDWRAQINDAVTGSERKAHTAVRQRIAEAAGA